MASDDLEGDLLTGVGEIAVFLNKTERQVYHLLGNGRLPGAFKLRGGKVWHMRKSRFRQGAEELETQGEPPEAA
jgi:hypothetical protein